MQRKWETSIFQEFFPIFSADKFTTPAENLDICKSCANSHFRIFVEVDSDTSDTDKVVKWEDLEYEV